MEALQVMLLLGFGAAFGLIVGWVLWGERE
jgi:hypothetical protein